MLFQCVHISPYIHTHADPFVLTEYSLFVTQSQQPTNNEEQNQTKIKQIHSCILKLLFLFSYRVLLSPPNLSSAIVAKINGLYQVALLPKNSKCLFGSPSFLIQTIQIIVIIIIIFFHQEKKVSMPKQNEFLLNLV